MKQIEIGKLAILFIQFVEATTVQGRYKVTLVKSSDGCEILEILDYTKQGEPRRLYPYMHEWASVEDALNRINSESMEEPP